MPDSSEDTRIWVMPSLSKRIEPKEELKPCSVCNKELKRCEQFTYFGRGCYCSACTVRRP